VDMETVKSGFLFFEIMVALVIIAGFALIVAYQQGAIAATNYQTHMRSKAHQRTTDVIEQINVSGQLPAISGLEQDGITISASAKSHRLSMPFNDTTLFKTYRMVEVTALWHSIEGTLEQYTVHMLI
jgi:Tfp pilus assembly protein PilV